MNKIIYFILGLQIIIILGGIFIMWTIISPMDKKVSVIMEQLNIDDITINK